MAATTQEEILSGILPKVNIDKITLTSPNEGMLNVALNVSIKEVLDDDFFGSWFEDININKYILVDIVQSTDETVTEALSYSNDMIQLCNLRRQINIKDTRTKALAYITGNSKVSDLLFLLEKHTLTQKLSINNTKNKITNFTSYTNNDGDKIYEIPYEIKFSLQNQPQHLAYFAVCSIDIDSLCADLKIDYDVAESFEENGRVVSEIVLNNSTVVGESYVYTDKNGVVWTGPVHQNEQEVWRSGDDETNESIDLDRILVTNTKIEDFRKFNRIERMMLDFNDDEKYNLLSQKQAQNITKIQSVDFKPNKNTPEFTQLFTSNDANGNFKFLFGVNFLNSLKNYSKFSKLLDSDNETFKQESIRETRIIDIKLKRRRIKNSIKQLEKLNPEEADEVILQSRDESWRNFIDVNDQNSSLKEVDIFTQNSNNYVRFFTGIDKTFKNLTDGAYQYYVEIEIEDGINDFIKGKLLELEAAKQLLVEYSNKISRPTMKKFIAQNSNPHIDSPSEYSQNSLVMDYGYDIVSNKLSPQLINKLITEYGGFTSPNTPWNSCTTIFAYILDIFSSDIKTDEDRQEISNSLFQMLNPNATNPEIVLRTIGMFDFFLTSISKTFDISLDSVSFTNLLSPLSARNSRSFKIIKIFDNLADTAMIKSFGIDYLSNNASQPGEDDGLLTISTSHYNTRIQNEMQKYFTTQNPSISFENSTDNVESVKYSYLSPTRIDFPGKSTVFSRISTPEQNNNTRNIEYFFQDNSFFKSVSLQADILNFRLDVSGKNRFLSQNNKDESQEQLSNSRTRGAGEKNRKTALNKMKEVLGQYSNITFNKYSTTQDRNIDDIRNDGALLNFVSSLSFDSIRDKQTIRNRADLNLKPLIPNQVKPDSLRQLSSLNTRSITVTNEIVTGFPKTFPERSLGTIPIQLRAMIFKSQELQSDIRDSVSLTDTYSTNTVNRAKNYFYFEMLTEIQYLERFDISDTGEQSTITPVWKTFNKQVIDNLLQNQEVLCRIRTYGNQNIDVKENIQVQQNCYDKHFIYKTARQIQIPAVRSPVIDNPLVNRFIDTIRINIPGIQITERFDLSRSLIIKPPAIQIIKTDLAGRTQFVEIKDVRNSIQRDISVAQSVKVGETTVPASVKAAVNVTSVSFQAANISNNVRASNFVPNINIKSTGRNI